MNKLQQTFKITALALFLGLSAVVSSAQTAETSGTVTMSGSVSNYVDLTSGGAASISGNTTGGITVDGVSGTKLAVEANLGELGPSNTNSFVKLTVPIRVRSNIAYIVNMQATVTSTGTSLDSNRRIKGEDIGFGIIPDARTGVGINSTGTDTGVVEEEPTTTSGAANVTTGRWEWTNANARLSSYVSATAQVMSGDYVLDPVPTTNTSAVTADTFFVIKPQFYEGGSSTTIDVTYTIVANP